MKSRLIRDLEVPASMLRIARDRILPHVLGINLYDFDLTKLAVGCYLQGVRDVAEATANQEAKRAEALKTTSTFASLAAETSTVIEADSPVTCKRKSRSKGQTKEVNAKNRVAFSKEIEATACESLCWVVTTSGC